jgi:predicted DNA-binding transcriptional regulator AlpA
MPRSAPETTAMGRVPAEAGRIIVGAATTTPEVRESPPKLAYTIPELCEASGISRAMIYREIKAQRLKVKKVGARTVIPVDEARAWMKV